MYPAQAEDIPLKPAVLFFSLLLAGVLALHAQVIPGRWEKADSIPPGTRVTVQDKSGESVEGSFLRSSPEDLTVSDATGQGIRLAKADVQRITGTEPVRDRVRNGTLIGLAIGAASGFAIAVGANAKATASGPIFDREDWAFYFPASLVGGGLGALAGWGIDAARKSPEVYFQSR